MHADDPTRVPHRENRFRGSDSLRGRCPIVIKKITDFWQLFLIGESVDLDTCVVEIALSNL